jgi:hypothetical protein
MSAQTSEYDSYQFTLLNSNTTMEKLQMMFALRKVMRREVENPRAIFFLPRECICGNKTI